MKRAALLVLVAVLALAAVVALHAPTRAALQARLGVGPGAEARINPAPAPEPPPPAITVTDAITRTFRDQLFVSGTLVAREEAMVGVQIDGLRIAEVLAEDGDSVRAGQVLARLDRTQLDALAAQNDAAMARAESTIAQARAQIEQVEATLAQARADYERGKTLGLGVLTQATLDQRLAVSKAAGAQLEGARSALGVAVADRKSQEAQRRELDVRIARTEVRAPVAGTVSRRGARVGALAMGSGEPLFRLIENGALDLDAEAPDDVLLRVKTGMGAQVTLGTDAPIAGHVRLVASEVDKATRLGRIRIALPPGAPGRIGAFATAIVDIAARDGVAVPASAVARGDRGRVVQVVAGDRVETRPVEIGLAYRDLVEITEGVKPGETVVARAAAFLRSGDAIRPIRPSIKETLR
jgi:HlyD family secretion protein